VVTPISMTTEEMTEAALQWFGSLGKWPKESVRQMVTQLRNAKTETAEYYGVQAILLSFLVANNGERPPMSPGKFSKKIIPLMPDLITRYAKSIMIVETRHDGT